MQTLVIGQRAGGEAVGKSRVAHKAAAQQRPLRRIVGQDAPLRHVFFAAKEQGAQVDEPLAREAAAPEGVHIQLPAEPAVGIGAARPGKDQREIGGVGALQIGIQPRVEDAVARADHALVLVEDRSAERVEHHADQLARRTGIEAGVAVEREQKARACERVPVAGDGEGGFPVAEQAAQLQQRAALALPSAPAFPVKAARTGEEVKAAGIAAVQAVDLLRRGGEDGRVGLRLLRIRLREVGQQPEAQLASLRAAGKAQLLQPPHRFTGAVFVV